MSRNPLVIAVGRVAWGYVFFYCALPFGYMNYATIDLMPDWAFYAFALAAIPAIARRERSAALLRPLGWLLLITEFAAWVLESYEVTLTGWYVYLPGALCSALAMYFHFQLLTNLADAAAPFVTRRVRSIKALAAVSAVLATLSTLPLPVDRLDEYDAGGLVMVIVLVWAIMLAWTLFTLTGLHGELRRAMPEDDIKENGE